MWNGLDLDDDKNHVNTDNDGNNVVSAMLSRSRAPLLAHNNSNNNNNINNNSNTVHDCHEFSKRSVGGNNCVVGFHNPDDYDDSDDEELRRALKASCEMFATEESRRRQRRRCGRHCCRHGRCSTNCIGSLLPTTHSPTNSDDDNDNDHCCGGLRGGDGGGDDHNNSNNSSAPSPAKRMAVATLTAKARFAHDCNDPFVNSSNGFNDDNDENDGDEGEEEELVVLPPKETTGASLLVARHCRHRHHAVGQPRLSVTTSSSDASDGCGRYNDFPDAAVTIPAATCCEANGNNASNIYRALLTLGTSTTMEGNSDDENASMHVVRFSTVVSSLLVDSTHQNPQQQGTSDDSASSNQSKSSISSMEDSKPRRSRNNYVWGNGRPPRRTKFNLHDLDASTDSDSENDAGDAMGTRLAKNETAQNAAKSKINQKRNTSTAATATAASIRSLSQLSELDNGSITSHVSIATQRSRVFDVPPSPKRHKKYDTQIDTTAKQGQRLGKRQQAAKEQQRQKQQKLAQEREHARQGKLAAQREAQQARMQARQDKATAVAEHRARQKHRRDEAAQAAGKYAGSEIAVLMDPALHDHAVIRVREQLEASNYRVQSYPSGLGCLSIQWIRKEYLHGGGTEAIQQMYTGNTSGYHHFPIMVILFDVPQDFISLLVRTHHDDDDDYPELELWLRGVEAGWRAAWKATTSAVDRPRIILLLYQVRDALDKMWVNYRKKSSRKKKGATQASDVVAPPTTDELEDAVTWMQIQFQVDCVFCQSVDDVAQDVKKMTRLLAEEPYQKCVTELECIKKLKPECDDMATNDIRARDCWLRQLQQIPRISRNMAAQLVLHYPTARLLWSAYQDPALTESQKQLLVSQCFGNRQQAKLSYWIYRVMTSHNSEELLE